MINDTLDTGPDTKLGPLLAFPELESGFPTLSSSSAHTCLNQCLLRLQQVPVDETDPSWVTRMGQTVRLLLERASGHSTEVLEGFCGLLGHWTIDNLREADAVAAEVLVTMFRHKPSNIKSAGRQLVLRLSAAVRERQALPAWTATLIGLIRRLPSDSPSAIPLMGALAISPYWQDVLSKEGVQKALASKDPEDLLRLVGQFSLLSLADIPQQRGASALTFLGPYKLSDVTAPGTREKVKRKIFQEQVRLHWLLTPAGSESIKEILAKARSAFILPVCQRIHRDIVLSLARYAAIERQALRGTEATLLLCQLFSAMQAAPGGLAPDAWALVWTAVNQLSPEAESPTTQAAPDTDRSRTVNTLLSPAGLSGQPEVAGWRLALLKQHGMALTDCLSHLTAVAQPPDIGTPMPGHLLQVAFASAQEHELALRELCSTKDMALGSGAIAYTTALLRRSIEMLKEYHDDSLTESPLMHDDLLLQHMAAHLPPGALMLGLFSHLDEELGVMSDAGKREREIKLTPQGAQWLVRQVKTSVRLLPANEPTTWVKEICASLDRHLQAALPPEAFAQWTAWRQAL